MLSVFGMIFCDDFKVVQEDTDTFCSRDGLYCTEAFEGQCIEAIRVQVAAIKSELVGSRDVLDSSRRDFLLKECRGFALRAQYLRADLAQKGLARPMTPVNVNEQEPISLIKAVPRYATGTALVSDFSTSASASAVRRSDRLTGRRRVSYNDDDDDDESSISDSRLTTDTADSPKSKPRRQPASNRSRGSTRRRRESRAATRSQKNKKSSKSPSSNIPAPQQQQPSATISALEKQQLSMLESQRIMASFPRTPQINAINSTPSSLSTPSHLRMLSNQQSQWRENNSWKRDYAHTMMANHMNPAAEVLRRAQTSCSPTDWQQPRTAFRPLMYFGDPTLPAYASNPYLTLPQYVSPQGQQNAVPRQLDMGGMANHNTHSSFPQMAPISRSVTHQHHSTPPMMGSLQGQTSMTDPFVEQQSYAQVDPRMIL